MPRLRTLEQKCGVHQRQVGERLRKVAQLALRLRVVLLGEQAQIVSQLEESLEHRLALITAPSEHQSIDEPERAGQEGAFLACESVTAGVPRGAVPGDHITAAQLRTDRKSVV